MKFEDYVLAHLYKVKKTIKNASPDVYDAEWIFLFDELKVAFAKSEGESYKTNINEFEAELKTLSDIYNDKSLMFPDLIQKAIDFLESQRKDIFND